MNIKTEPERNIGAVKNISDQQEKISDCCESKTITIIYFNACNYLVKRRVLLFIVNELDKKDLLIFYLDLIIK